jgi:hypothetical protein
MLTSFKKKLLQLVVILKGYIDIKTRINIKIYKRKYPNMQEVKCLPKRAKAPKGVFTPWRLLSGNACKTGCNL